MKILSSADQKCIPKASLLLRLARALNLSRSHAIQDVHIRRRNGQVQLLVDIQGRSPADLELWAVEKERDYFREVFGRELSAAAAA